MTTGPAVAAGAPVGLKALRRLARQRRAREEAGWFVVEGTTSVGDALAAGHPLVEVFAEPDADPDVLAAAHQAGVPVTDVPAGRLDGIVSTRSPQPIAAVGARTTVEARGVRPGPTDLVVVLVDVGDPGNVGTLLRVAEASGAGAVLCLGDTADPFNPKSVRASAGSLFAVDVALDKEAAATVEALRAAGWTCVATSPRAELAYDRADLTGPVAVVLGSEPHGLPPGLDDLDVDVSIPMVGRAESLNVAMAGAVLCFEALRQRRATTEVPSSS